MKVSDKIPKKQLTSSNLLKKNTRGISADINKKTPKGLTNLSFHKLVTQTTKSYETETIYKTTEKEKILHSQSPKKILDPDDLFLLPPQRGSNLVQ